MLYNHKQTHQNLLRCYNQNQYSILCIHEMLYFELVIGYRIQNDPTTGEPNFILDNPYPGPSESNLDLWLGYDMKLTDKIDWRIQLNVYNVGDDESLIPLTTQPDGTPAGYRISPTQIWRVTSTFKF